MLARELKRLGSQSAIYGLGGIVSRLIAVFLLPVYTVYLGTVGFGKIETIIALTSVLVILLRLGITSAFFRFYFDSEDAARRTLVVRTSFWFTMGMATLGLILGFVFAPEISSWLNLDDPWLVRAGFVGLWAQMNYAQVTALFRVEERPVGFAIASVANVLITIGATIALVVGAHKGAIGAVVGNFLGTLTVYVVLLAYRRYQLGFQFDRHLLRQMNRFGLPLVPAALALWVINLIDRLFINAYKGQAEVGIYSLAVRIASIDRLPDDRLPARLARVRLLDPRRDRREAHVLLRPHLPALHHLLDVARPRRARTVDRRHPRAQGELRPLRRGGSAPLLRDRRVLRLLGARDRDRPDAPDPAELGRQRRSRRS